MAQSDVMCSLLTREAHTTRRSRHHARSAHHVPRKRNTSFQKRKSSPMDCFRFWLRRRDLNHTVSLRLGHGLALTVHRTVIHFRLCSNPLKCQREKKDTRRCPCVGGGEGIRTLVGLPPNGFQDRLVVTASIRLHARLLYQYFTRPSIV